MELRGSMAKITEQTLIPLTMVGCVIGFTMWLTSMSFQVQANTKRLDAIELKQDAYNDSVHKIQTDLALIKQALGVRETAPRKPSQEESH